MKAFLSDFFFRGKNGRHGLRAHFPVLFWAVAIAFAEVACSTSDELKVIGRNFTEEVGLSQNLVFTFNRNIWPEGRLQEWDSTGYIHFEPAIPGKFKWTAPNELVFSPAEALREAADYKASLTSLLLAGSEQNLSVASERIAFHTPYLKLAETRGWWVLSSESGTPEPRLLLKFNYPVNPKNVTDRLKISDTQGAMAFRPVPAEDPHSVLVIPETVRTPDRNPVALQIHLDPGLKTASGTYASKEPVTEGVSFPSSLSLEVSDIVTGFEGTQGYVRIFTSQELTGESLTKGYSLQPGLQLTAEKTDNGFILRGNFPETETCLLKLTSALKSTLGHTLEEEVSKDLFFGKVPAGVAFVSRKALYLTPKGSKNIGVQITNIPTVRVKIVKIYENNILHYLNHGRYQHYTETDGVWGPDGTYEYSEDYQGQYSDVVVNKLVSTADLAGKQGISALNIAVPDDGGRARKGIYLVSVTSEEEIYLSQSKLVAVSDIGLIVKQGMDDLSIFANSIHSSDPLAGVEITLFSSNNQPLHTVTTDSKGVARISKLSEMTGRGGPGLSSFRPAMITARTTDDFNYLHFPDTRIEMSRFEVEGSRSNVTGLQAFIYGERDIYRPGETLYYNTVIRTDDWQTAADIPVKLKLITPNGQVYRTWRKQTNTQGAVEVSARVEEASLTGSYTFEVYNANDVLLASQFTNVEEFIPDRIKVDLSGGKAAYTQDETITLTATALNLFGPPAVNRNYEMESLLKRKQFRAANFPEFSFDMPVTQTFERIRKQGVTDQAGSATEAFPLPAAYKDIGILEGKIYVTVFDETGRAVNRLHSFDVFTQPVFYGVRIPEKYVGVHAPLPIEVISVDTRGALSTGISAQVEIVRIAHQTVVEKRNGQLRYTSRRNEQAVYTNTLRLTHGKGVFHYTPTVSGEYEVRVRRPGALHYATVPFHAYGYGYTQYSSFEVSNEGRVLIETDKSRYAPGEKARILFKTPFDGKLLVTIERDKLLEHHVLATEKKAAALSLKMTEAFLPNVYVTATLIRPLDASRLPLTVAQGFAPVIVEAPDRKLEVKITAAAASRSKTKQRIRLKTQPKAQVTVSVVDEGILQIKNFRTPDIHGFFYQKRALEVSSHNLYAFLFPELDFGTGSSSGGDGYNLERRINPLSNGRKDLIRFWSGILDTDSRGEAFFDIDLPQFSGDLRVMAVAYKGKAFGSAAHHMKVADPVVLSAGLPRFLSPGDALTLPVTVINTESRPTEATISIHTAGAVRMKEGEASKKITLAPGKEQRIDFPIEAAGQLGDGTVTIQAKAFGENFSQEYSVNVRPPSPLLKNARSGMIAGGKTESVSFPDGFLPGTARSRLVLSRSPLVQGAGKALSALLGYPHGCLEQVISRAFPQIYFADLSKAMASGMPSNGVPSNGVPSNGVPSNGIYLVRHGESDFNPVTNVQQAIRKTESQQLFNGGFALWPGAFREDWWLTAYAVHFLYEAQQAGFEINASLFSRALDYLTSKTGTPAGSLAAGHLEQATVMNEDGSQVQQKVASREAVYSLHVLAVAGRPNRAAMNYYKQNQHLLTNETRFLLAGAYQFTGDPKSFEALLPEAFTPSETTQPGNYGSPLASLGLVLNTLLETDSQNPRIPVLARQLSQAVATAPYLNTQEAAFAVLGLGKIAHRHANSTVNASVAADGKVLGTFDGQDLTLTEGLLSQKITIKTEGSGDLYWFAETEGMNAAGTYTEEDAGLRVRRAYLNREGRPVTSFRQNDLIVVKITLASTNGLNVPHIVVTDLLPAGFEVENPRLTATREMPWIKNPASPDYFDIRDDRIHYFTTASATEKAFYYQVRVTAKGTFTAGPIAADAMYQGDYRSYSGGKKVSVN